MATKNTEERANPDAVPFKPVFLAEDLMELCPRLNRIQISRLRKKGWLRSVPGYEGRVYTPRAEVLRWLRGEKLDTQKGAAA